jgi:hypothetical protein
MRQHTSVPSRRAKARSWLVTGPTTFHGSRKVERVECATSWLTSVNHLVRTEKTPWFAVGKKARCLLHLLSTFLAEEGAPCC